jgi:diguanylate cyclase (GGDEF)-like protein/PAS domain S-box-containing protein
VIGARRLAKTQTKSPTHIIPATADDLLKAFLEHIPDGVYFKDRESRFVRISRSLAARFGFTSPTKAVSKSDFDVFSKEHAQQAFADEQQIIRTGQPILEKEEKETWPDGRENWVLTTKLPLVDGEGNVIGTMGISRDITERKRLEQELDGHRADLEKLVRERTAELALANELLQQDIAARKIAEQELAEKAQALAAANAELENLSLVDDLTGLYNRRGFLALARHQSRLALRNRTAFSIAFLDLDGLKQINDTLGHRAGDLALVEAAGLLKACFRTSDILARIGGDEFAVFVADANEKETTARIEERLYAHRITSDHPYQLSFSIGIVSSALQENPTIENLLTTADSLMYEQKRKKASLRNGVTADEGPKSKE